MRLPLETFTEPGMAIGPVAHILSNVMYIYEHPEWQSPEQIQQKIYDWQYMWGAGVEMAFLTAYGFQTRYRGALSHQDFLNPEHHMLRGLVGKDFQARAELFQTPEIIEERQEATRQYMTYFNESQGRALYIQQRATHKSIISALNQGMVVDLVWGGGRSLETMAALAYSSEGRGIDMYCPYWNKDILRTFSQEKFLDLWRDAYGFNVYWYIP